MNYLCSNNVQTHDSVSSIYCTMWEPKGRQADTSWCLPWIIFSTMYPKQFYPSTLETIPRLVRNAVPAKYFCVLNWYATWFNTHIKMFLAPEELSTACLLCFLNSFLKPTRKTKWNLSQGSQLTGHIWISDLLNAKEYYNATFGVWYSIDTNYFSKTIAWSLQYFILKIHQLYITHAKE